MFIPFKEKKSLVSYPLEKDLQQVPMKFVERLQVLKDYVEQELEKHNKISIEDVKLYCTDKMKIKRVKDYKLHIRHLLNDLELVVREPLSWSEAGPLSWTSDSVRFNPGPFEIFDIDIFLEFSTDHFIFTKKSKEFKKFMEERIRNRLEWDC
ncbi:MAG: hypothetical protein ACFE9L_18605 [Candidatus Hodarchaeota archaeon]